MLSIPELGGMTRIVATPVTSPSNGLENEVILTLDFTMLSIAACKL